MACRELMRGYSMTIGPKCEFYAHRALSISRPRGWLYADLDAYRYIGQCFWGREQYDSALVYYNRAPEAPAGPPITPREREILDFLSKGYTTPQIAEGLGLSAETVKWYRKKLLAKFDVANAAELVIIAKRDGVI